MFGGYSDDDSDEDYIVDDMPKEVKAEKHEDSVVTITEQNNNEIPEGVFDGLIDIINANLSPMVLQCLDVEAEKKYLYQALGPRFSEFVKNTREHSIAAARDEWDREKAEMKRKIDDFKGRCATAENDMNEMKALKMSDERQRLALKERIRKLEEQLETIEAEKEQRIIENKSLLNKLKVLQVRNGSTEEDDKLVLELSEKIETLEKELAAKVAEVESVSAQKEAEYKEQLDKAETVAEKLRAEIVTLKEIQSIPEVNEEVEAEREALRTENLSLKTASDALKAEKDELDAKLKSAEIEIAEFNENMNMLDAIQEELNKVEDFKKRKDEEVETLKKAITEKDKTIADLSDKFKDEESEKCAAIEAEKNGEIATLKKRIATLESDLNESNTIIGEKDKQLADGATRESQLVAEVTARKNDVDEAMTEIDNLRGQLDDAVDTLSTEREALMSEINRLKTENVEKVNKLQAEIAALQAKLDVQVLTDDSLVDENLKQEVESTFDVNIDDSEFVEFEVSSDVVEEKEAKQAESEEFNLVSALLDEEDKEFGTPVANHAEDIDWLLPDVNEILNTEIIEEANKDNSSAWNDSLFANDEIENFEENVDEVASVEVKEEEKQVAPEKSAPQDMQMSLFG